MSKLPFFCTDLRSTEMAPLIKILGTLTGIHARGSVIHVGFVSICMYTYMHVHISTLALYTLCMYMHIFIHIHM